MKIDNHTHSCFSMDSEAPFETMIEAAIAQNFDELVLTDHFDFYADGTPYPNAEPFDVYYARFLKLQERYADTISLVYGAELGIGSHLGDVMQAFAQNSPAEFIIGSVHDIQGVELWFDHYFLDKTKQQAYTNYFEEVHKAMQLVPFQVLGHLDYIARYGIYEDNSAPYAEFRECVDAVLKEAVTRGIGLEINTSGYRYGLNMLHPQPAILTRYRELGGEIVTIGSDAHRPDCVGEHFNLAYDCLESLGFRYITRFRDRKPQFVPIAEARK